MPASPVPTPRQRFAAHDLLTSLGRNGATTGKTARALRAAQQWDGFPDSYHSTQVEAGRELIIAVSEPDMDDFEEAVESVLELIDAERSQVAERPTVLPSAPVPMRLNLVGR